MKKTFNQIKKTLEDSLINNNLNSDVAKRAIFELDGLLFHIENKKLRKQAYEFFIRLDNEFQKHEIDWLLYGITEVYGFKKYVKLSN